MRKMSPLVSGIVAFAIVLVSSFSFIIVLTLLGPELPLQGGLAGSLMQIASFMGIYGALIIGIAVFFIRRRS